MSCDCIIQSFTDHSVSYPSEFLTEHLCTQVITLNKHYRDHGNGDEVPAIKDHVCTKLAICFLAGIPKSPPLPVKDIYYFLEQLETLSHLSYSVRIFAIANLLYPPSTHQMCFPHPRSWFPAYLVSLVMVFSYVSRPQDLPITLHR